MEHERKNGNKITFTQKVADFRKQFLDDSDWFTTTKEGRLGTYFWHCHQ